MGGFSRAQRRYSSKRSSGSSGRGNSSPPAGLIVLFFIFGIILALWKYLLVGAAVVVVGIVVYSISAISNAKAVIEEEEKERQRQEEQKKEKEKQKALAWLKEPEPGYECRIMPSINDSCKEASRIGNEYIGYLREKDCIDQLEQHLEWIDKYDSICQDYSVTDPEDYSEERRKCEQNARRSRQRLKSLKYTPLFELDNNVFPSLSNAYDKLLLSLNHSIRREYDYTQDVYGYFDKRAAMEQDDLIYKTRCFVTPWYVVLVQSSYQPSLSLLQYGDVKLNMWCDEEEVYYEKSSDDVSRIVWEHATKDGSPDLRYSNNERSVYVYRGRVSLSFGSSNNDITLKFPNKKWAQDFCAAWEEYADLLNKRGNIGLVKAVLNNSSSSLDDYYKKKQQEIAKREKKSKKEKNYIDSLKPGMIVKHKKLGDGEVISIENGVITVDFAGERKRFKYPDAFKKGFFVLNI